jgi:hypothetical protein
MYRIVSSELEFANQFLLYSEQQWTMNEVRQIESLVYSEPTTAILLLIIGTHGTVAEIDKIMRGRLLSSGLWRHVLLQVISVVTVERIVFIFRLGQK